MQDATEQAFSIQNAAIKGTTTEDKQQILKDIGPKQIAKGREPIPGEKEKTIEDIALISLAKTGISSLRSKFGLEPFEISVKNIHLLPGVGSQKVESGTVRAGGSDPETQSVVAREGRSKTETIDFITHELLHLSSYGAMQITTEGEEDYSYRAGFTAVSRDGKRQYFHLVDEALNELLTKQVVESVKENPLLIDEANETKLFLDLEKAENPDDVISARFKGDVDDGDVDVLRYKYPEERKVLGSLVEKIFQRNSQRFSGKEDIYNMFFNGKLQGNLYEIGKLIDNTFGKGTFRRIGEVSNTVHVTEEYRKYIDAL